MSGDINLVLAGLFHDISKKDSAVPREGSEFFLCRDHEKKGASFALRHVNFIHSFPGADLGQIVWLVDNHMRIKTIDQMKGFKKTEITDNIWFDDLVLFSKADDMNRDWDMIDRSHLLIL